MNYRSLSLAAILAAGTAMPALAQDDTATTETEATTTEAESTGGDEAQSTASASDVVVTVNGTEITLGEMIIARNQLPAQYQQLPPEALFDGLVNQIVQQQVLADTVDGTPERVEFALSNERRSLLAGEAVNALMGEGPSDEELQAAYDEAFADVEPVTEYHARHILVDTQDEATAVIERLNAGEDFDAVAQEVSTDTGSGAQGGDLGWFADGMMVQPFQDAVSELEPGEMSEPVETQFGWHVIELQDTRMQEAPSLDEVRDQLTQQIQQQQVEDRLAELEGEAEITRNEDIAPSALSDTSLLAD
ncbi:peptidylprolyl isomerase [Pseudoroseicyclus aestuarii]|uniref:Parvulin-like PPIase n=1 Tax=Pseudoroseicyclus aestuarii TaxID=1795041 RepID=A0A318T7Q8_9RHOB|nr:peptidylprolyl isomerase [Pseudoroseicyclus aestuarii]PYE84428.1 peptidyl-prolyl cis-trans isomerase C [Pseudoroseicyclus aestuarii]